MKIRFERSGGFAGMTRTVEVATDALSEDQRELVTSLVRSADFFALPQNPAPRDPNGADRFSYTITIDSAARTHTIETNDAAMPESLVPLIDWLNRRQ